MPAALWTTGVVTLLLTTSASALATPSDSTTARQVDSLRRVDARTIVVTGTRNDVLLANSPVRVEVIGKDRIATSAMVNLGDLLKEQSGLLMTGTVRTGVQMNGLGSDYTLILIDGQPIVGRVAGVLDLSRVSVGNIERVEVVKGPMSSMYGSEALAGVINIITKRPNNGWTGRVGTQALSRGPVDLQAETGWAGADGEFSAFVNVKQAEPFSIEADSMSVPYAGFRDATVHLKGLWEAAPGWKLRSSLRAFGSESRGTFVESVFGQVASNSGSVTQTDVSGMLGLEYQHGRARLQTTAYATTYHERYDFDVDQGRQGAVDNLERRTGRIYSQYDLFFEDRDRLTVGGEFLYDDVSGSRYADSLTPGYRPFYRTAVAFTQWEGQPTSWISYVLSGRFDGNNVFGSALSPRLSILWKPTASLSVNGSIGTGFKAPDFRQLFVAFSNRLPGASYDLIGAARLGIDLQPERSVSYDLGIRYSNAVWPLSDDLTVVTSVELRAFRNDIRNLIEYFLAGRVDNRAVYSYRNVAQATTQGIEASWNAGLSMGTTGMITLRLGYQYLHAVDRDVVKAIDRGQAGTVFERLTHEAYRGLWLRSAHSGTARLQYDSHDRRWSTNVRWQFVGSYGDEALDRNGVVISDPPRKVYDRDDEAVPGYVVTNLALTRSFPIDEVLELTVGAMVNNLTDVVNPQLIPGLVGRQFALQAGLRF